MREPSSLDYINISGQTENILILWKDLAQRFICVNDVSFASLLFLHCTAGFIWQEMISYIQQIYKSRKMYISNIIFPLHQ